MEMGDGKTGERIEERGEGRGSWRIEKRTAVVEKREADRSNRLPFRLVLAT